MLCFVSVAVEARAGSANLAKALRFEQQRAFGIGQHETGSASGLDIFESALVVAERGKPASQRPAGGDSLVDRVRTNTKPLELLQRGTRKTCQIGPLENKTIGRPKTPR